MLQHQPTQIAQRQAGVEDVLNQDHMASFNWVVDVLDELDGAGGDAGAAVAGDGDKIEGVVDLDGAGEVCEKDGCSFEDADEDDGLAFVVGGDLSSNFAGAIGDLLFGEENLHLCGGGEDGRA